MPRKSDKPQSHEPRVTFRLPLPLLRKLDRVARANDRTVSAEIRQMVRAQLDEEKEAA